MEKIIGTFRHETRGKRTGVVCVLALLVIIALAGCARQSAFDRGEAPFTRVFTPLVPEFLIGPAGALLTNTGGFSARATLESNSPLAPTGVDVMEGELLGQGTLLLFAPRTSETAKKEIRLGGFSFIWDVATSSGYVLSETLQGYAPVSSTLKVAKVTVQPGAGPGEESAVVALDDGSAWLFRLWRTPGMKHPPSRISTVTNAPAFSLKLAKVRPESPPVSLFTPPEGFVKYANPEALADELAARKNEIKRGARSEAERIYMQNYGR